MQKIINKAISVLTAFLLLFYQSIFPVLALAQDATPEPSPEISVESSPSPEPSPSPEVTEEPQTSVEPSAQPSPSETPQPSEEPSPSPTLSVSEELTISTDSAQIDISTNNDQQSASIAPSIWKSNDDGSSTTVAPVTLNTTYKAPQNDKATVTFTKLSENLGTLTIKEVRLTKEQIIETGALSETAYEITSTMENGTFEYTLTLPTLSGQNIEVKYSEDGQNFSDIEGEQENQDVVVITGLTHFTIFVVAGTVNGNTATAFDETSVSILINEFVVDPSGNEWVELYNKSGENIDLSNWKLEDNSDSSGDITLSGTILAGGFLVFENNSGWLNNPTSNDSGDTITLKNSNSEVIDRVTYVRKTGSTVVTNADDLGVSSIDEEESIGRTSDGVVSGDVWTTYSSPTKGYNNSGDTTFITVGEIL